MFACFPAVWRIQFQRAIAALGILVLLDFAVPTADTDDQVLILMGSGIDSQSEASNFQLQDAITDKSADASCDVYSVSGHAPFGAD
jgi:hypothetical protein